MTDPKPHESLRSAVQRYRDHHNAMRAESQRLAEQAQRERDAMAPQVGDSRDSADPGN